MAPSIRSTADPAPVATSTSCRTASSELFSFTEKASVLPSQEGDQTPSEVLPSFDQPFGSRRTFSGPGSLPPVEDRLLLRRGPPLVEEAPAALHRESDHLLDVEELLEPLRDGVPLREARQEVARQLLLGVHPGLRARGLRVLQPAVGVGDRDAVDHVHDLLAGGGGVVEGRLHRGPGRGGASGGGGAGGEEGGGDGCELRLAVGHGRGT